MRELPQEVERLDRQLLGKLQDCRESPSHDRLHTDRVLGFARELMLRYGGDQLVVTLAVRLHDLGRQDPAKHGGESVTESCRLARRILDEVGVEYQTAQRVIDVIEDHDDISRSPRSLEAEVVRDADFLAGFGAWGILRSCMWAGESGGGVEGATRRLSRGMCERAEALVFPESRRYASTRMADVRFFLQELGQTPQLRSLARQGAYIVFEGISGSGKNTQMRLLRERLEGLGRDVVEVAEPPDPYRALRRVWASLTGGRDATSDEKVFLLLATRTHLVGETLLPALDRGAVVLSSRSYISTLVYQESGVLSREFVALCHRSMPPLDRLFLLDAIPEEAFQRLRKRADRLQGELSEYEGLELLSKHRAAYLDVCRHSLLPLQVDVVPPGSVQQTGEHVWESVSKLLMQ